MGWTGFYPGLSKFGRKERIMECDALIDNVNYKVVKSTLIGSTYYAAVEELKTSKVFAAVILTKLDKDGMFWYKSMDETAGPCEINCPHSIMKLLSPTDNQYAKEWREKVTAANEEAKAKAKVKRDVKKDTVGYVVRLNNMHTATGKSPFLAKMLKGKFNYSVTNFTVYTKEEAEQNAGILTRFGAEVLKVTRDNSKQDWTLPA